MHWSLLVIFGLIVVALADSQLPHSVPGHTAAYDLAAVGVAAAFCAAVGSASEWSPNQM